MNNETMTMPAGAGVRQWAGLGVLALPTLVLALDMSVLYLAAPAFAADLGATNVEQLWIIDIYGFMIAGFLMAMGTLGDRIGRRKLLILGAAAFGIASLAAAFSSSPTVLIVARASLGIAGATLMPSTLALISNMFTDPRQRTAAISIWIACFMSGMALGPIIGGALLQAFWWGSVFVLAVPVMLVLLVAAPLLLPEYRDAGAGRIDFPSVLLSLATILPLVYGFKHIASYGLSATPVAAISVASVLGVVFVRRQLVLPEPLVNVRLFQNRPFATTLAAILITTAAGGGMYLLASQYLQLVASLSPLRAGLWLVPTGVASIAGALSAPRLAARFSPGSVVAAGLAVAVVGYIMLAAASADTGFALVVAGIALVFFGSGPISALGTDLVVGTVEPQKAGSAASMSETSTELGISLGVALLGSLSTLVYGHTLHLPGELPLEAELQATDTFAGAVAAADGLSDNAASHVIASGQEAFTTGLNVVAIIAASLVGLLAVVARVWIRPRT